MYGRYGKVVRPTLGINVADDRVARSVGAQLGRALQGALVVDVAPQSPAAAAGLRPCTFRADGSVELGDLLTHVGDTAVRQVEDLLSAIEERAVGETVEIRVHRRCDPADSQTLRVTLTSRDALPVQPRAAPGAGRLRSRM